MHSLQYSFMNDIVWNEYGNTDHQFPLSSNIDIWRIAVSPNLDLINRFQKTLSIDENARALRFHQQKDTQRFLISRIVLRNLLAGYSKQSPDKIQFAEGLNKKPFAENVNLADLHFNISHSGDLILIAIANSEIGVDVEKNDDNFSYKEILPQNFSDEEIRFIKKPEDFYLLWTRKEALLKATAKGLDDDLPRVPSLDGIYNIKRGELGLNKNWIIKSFQVEKDYVGSIAYSSDKHALNFFDIMLL